MIKMKVVWYVVVFFLLFDVSTGIDNINLNDSSSPSVSSLIFLDTGITSNENGELQKPITLINKQDVNWLDLSNSSNIQEAAVPNESLSHLNNLVTGVASTKSILDSSNPKDDEKYKAKNMPIDWIVEISNVSDGKNERFPATFNSTLEEAKTHIDSIPVATKTSSVVENPLNSHYPNSKYLRGSSQDPSLIAEISRNNYAISNKESKPDESPVISSKTSNHQLIITPVSFTVVENNMKRAQPAMAAKPQTYSIRNNIKDSSVKFPLENNLLLTDKSVTSDILPQNTTIKLPDKDTNKIMSNPSIKSSSTISVSYDINAATTTSTNDTTSSITDETSLFPHPADLALLTITNWAHTLENYREQNNKQIKETKLFLRQLFQISSSVMDIRHIGLKISGSQIYVSFDSFKSTPCPSSFHFTDQLKCFYLSPLAAFGPLQEKIKMLNQEIYQITLKNESDIVKIDRDYSIGFINTLPRSYSYKELRQIKEKEKELIIKELKFRQQFNTAYLSSTVSILSSNIGVAIITADLIEAGYACSNYYPVNSFILQIDLWDRSRISAATSFSRVKSISSSSRNGDTKKIFTGKELQYLEYLKHIAMNVYKDYNDESHSN